MTDRRNIFIPTRKVRGTACGERRKIAIGFPKALFDQINFLASTNGRSFNEQAVVLVETALENKNPVALEIVDSPRSTVEGL